MHLLCVAGVFDWAVAAAVILFVFMDIAVADYVTAIGVIAFVVDIPVAVICLVYGIWGCILE